MPLYTYECPNCGIITELLVSINERDSVENTCFKCETVLRRCVDKAAYHGEKYQMKAILADKSQVKGHFGKSAPLVRKK